jgi:hypothetical protein
MRSSPRRRPSLKRPGRRPDHATLPLRRSALSSGVFGTTFLYERGHAFIGIVRFDSG